MERVRVKYGDCHAEFNPEPMRFFAALRMTIAEGLAMTSTVPNLESLNFNVV
jgi:hypothetical protein